MGQGYSRTKPHGDVCWEGTLLVCKMLLANNDYTDPVRRKVCEQILAVGQNPWPWKQRTEAQTEKVETTVEVAGGA